jgi:hypothetical protein
MIHNQIARQPFEQRFPLGKFPAVHLELDVPAEIVNPGGHLFENIPRQCTTG